MARTSLTTRPRFHRTPKAVGLLSADLIEPDGGRHEAGLIRDVAVVTRGEALGHGYWIDRDFLFSTKNAINAAPQGIKSRFTHPGLSADGLGSYLGRLSNATVRDGAVHADLHFAKSAHDTPDGDLAEYVMRLAADDPAAFGMSIVFAPDEAAEEEFTTTHTDPESGDFRSPDEQNYQHLPHARLAQLRAGDCVDEPAANPSGLFHRQDIATQADDLARYALGLTPTPPAPMAAFDIHPQRLADYVARFLARHNLEIKEKETMSDTAPPAAEPEPVAEEPAQVATLPPDQDAPAEQDHTEPEPAPAPDPELEPRPAAEPEPVAAATADPLADARLAVAEHIRLFGPRGAEWFAAGKTRDECYELAIAELREENARLKQALTAHRGAAAPAQFNPEPSRPASANPCRIRAASRN